MAQSVKRLTLHLSLGHNLIICGFKPHIGLCVDSGGCLGFSLSLSLCSSPVRAHTHSLRINFKKKEKKSRSLPHQATAISARGSPPRAPTCSTRSPGAGDFPGDWTSADTEQSPVSPLSYQSIVRHPQQRPPCPGANSSAGSLAPFSTRGPAAGRRSRAGRGPRTGAPRVSTGLSRPLRLLLL